MNFSELWNKIKIRKWAKYVITLVVFLIIYLFVSDQSMLQFVKRGREIRSLEQQRDIYREQTEKAESELKTLISRLLSQSPAVHDYQDGTLCETHVSSGISR